MQGNIDNELQFSGRFNWRWASNFITKTSCQLTSQGNMLSVENDYTGADFSASLKAVNPSILDGGLTGMVMASYLQAVTPRLSLGIDAFWSRPAMAYPPSLNVSYAARYKALDWMACAQLVPGNAIEASYWRKLSEKVDAGINCNLAFAGMGPAGPMGGPTKEGTVTIGAKYDFRQSVFRAQLDNSGKVGVLLEKQVMPPIRVTFSGEIDHKQVRCARHVDLEYVLTPLAGHRQGRPRHLHRGCGPRGVGAARVGRCRSPELGSHPLLDVPQSSRPHPSS